MIAPQRFLITLLTVALQLATPVQAASCEFCPDNLWDFNCNTNGPCGSINTFWVEQGKTCNDVYTEAISGQRSCSGIINQHRDVCCNGAPATQAPQTPGPTYEGRAQGTEPPCDICFSGLYPTNPSTTISSNFITGGSANCHELYWDGKEGYINGPVCYPLQLFAQGPCGCDAATVPPNNPAPTPKPTPQPTSPAPPTTPEIPQRRTRPAGASKSSLKVSYGRTRGTTNSRGLRGEEEGDALLKEIPVKQGRA